MKLQEHVEEDEEKQQQQQWEQQLQGVRFQLLLRPLVTQRSSCTCCIVLSRLLLMIIKIKFRHVIFFVAVVNVYLFPGFLQSNPQRGKQVLHFPHHWMRVSRFACF